MGLLDDIANGFRTYPYKKRVPKAATAIICGIIFGLHHPKPASLGDAILIGSVFLILFFRPEERPFWFFAGIAFGGLLLLALPELRFLLPH